jgi:hypothetical protein
MTSTHPKLLALLLSAHAGLIAASPIEIHVLSNRADLISGGSALIEVVVDGTFAPSSLRVDLDGQEVTDAFAVRADGRFYGLVEGLRDGINTLTARVAGGQGARIVSTNHPKGGPVFSGAQVQPWICQTTNSPSLGPAIDAQCNAPTAYRYLYRNTAGQFASYDPANPPPASSIAMTTTDQGVTVPYIVRIERGTMNRGIHEIAVLADPAKPWAPWSPQDQPGWNHKLYIPFGSGCEFSHFQGNPGGVMNHNALSQGFMVMSSSNTQYGTHCNDVVSAETVMMLKEHVVENYGPIRYTLATGSSGGAHQQHLHSSNYPGLLQGIIPSAAFQDTWTPYREFGDCGLLARFYAQKVAAGMPWTENQKAKTDGHANASTCEGPIPTFMASRTAAYMNPTVGAGCQGNSWTWSPTNLTGERCTLQDYQVAVFGHRALDATDPVGYARRALDNTGLQYGLAALKNGDITPEMFVDLNANIGCYDINQNWQPQRCEADSGAAEIAHSSGRVTHGRQMGKVAIIDLRDNDAIEEHYNFRTYVTRNRLLNANGTAANMAIWRTTTGAAPDANLAFNTMSRWLADIEADTRNVPLERKVIDNRPALGVDTCFLGTTPVDASLCDAVYRTFTDTRVAAGEPPTSDVMKCQLKPLNRTDPDYTSNLLGLPVQFTDTQWARLQQAFPNGVCDWSKPGVGQVTPEPWQTFADGPGGRPLGDAPASEPFRLAPDLAPGVLTLSKQRVHGGDQVTFSAVAANLGNADAAGVVVRFLLDGVQLGADQTIASLAANAIVNVSSAVWNAKHEQGSHSVQVVLDPADAIAELSESNNSASASFLVEGNKIRNGSFEQSSNGASPDAWTSSGATSYENGGTDGERSASTQPGGSWSSEPVPVMPGATYLASVQVAGSGGTLVIQQLAPDGTVLAVASQVLPVAALFQSVGLPVTALAGAAHLRVVLLGGLTGKTTFDNVQLIGG